MNGFFRNIWLAARLAQFQGDAVERYPDDDRAFWRSFIGLFLILALDFLISDLSISAYGDPEAGLSRAPTASAWLAVGWLLNLAIAAEFARLVKRADRWPRFVVAHNWTSLLQSVVLATVIVVLASIEATSKTYDFWLVVLGFWSLMFDWYVVKVALKIDGPPAALLIAIMLAASLLVKALALDFMVV